MFLLTVKLQLVELTKQEFKEQFAAMGKLLNRVLVLREASATLLQTRTETNCDQSREAQLLCI